MWGGWGQTEEEGLPLPQPGPHPTLFAHIPRSTFHPPEIPKTKDEGGALMPRLPPSLTRLNFWSSRLDKYSHQVGGCNIDVLAEIVDWGSPTLLKKLTLLVGSFWVKNAACLTCFFFSRIKCDGCVECPENCSTGQTGWAGRNRKRKTCRKMSTLCFFFNFAFVLCLYLTKLESLN